MTQESSIGKFKRALIGPIDRIRCCFALSMILLPMFRWRRLTYIYSHN